MLSHFCVMFNHYTGFLSACIKCKILSGLQGTTGSFLKLSNSVLSKP